MQRLIKFYFFLLILLLVVPPHYGQEMFEIEGAITIKSSHEATPHQGTIRFNSSTFDFEGWNGVFWASLTGFNLGSVQDIDNHTYRTITIGNQEWMVENLRTTKYRNGDEIPNVSNNTDWSNLGSGAYSWYANDNTHEYPYGKLYNYYAVNDNRGLCPSGWHIPTDEDYTTLTDFLGGLNQAGGLMKESGIIHWQSPNNATNTSGFTGLPGGYRQIDGAFDRQGITAYYWSQTEASSTDAWYRVLSNITTKVSRFIALKKTGFSVRCLRN